MKRKIYITKCRAPFYLTHKEEKEYIQKDAVVYLSQDAINELSKFKVLYSDMTVEEKKVDDVKPKQLEIQYTPEIEVKKDEVKVDNTLFETTYTKYKTKKNSSKKKKRSESLIDDEMGEDNC